jgi:hypothetical protein
VKVYLLLVSDEQFFFYSDESEADESRVEAPAQGGWRGELEERWHRFQRAWHESDAEVARWARRSWDWLHSMIHPDEWMLVRFRSTQRIDLHHPAARSRDAVARAWLDYLGRKWRRHMIFLCGNALIAPLALALLWPLPGPNLIGYWFAYRAIHHYLIVRGINRVRKGSIPTEYHPEPSLDLPVSHDHRGKSSHAAINGRGHRLDDFVNVNRPSSGTAAADASEG